MINNNYNEMQKDFENFLEMLYVNGLEIDENGNITKIKEKKLTLEMESDEDE